MSKIMALDIETGNFSWEIGGWDKHSLFEPTVVGTWDGEEAHVFSKADVEIEGVTVHPLHPRAVGEHLEKHINAGGVILGHNIRGFDLPVLNAALDCKTAGDLMGKSESVIDTKLLVDKAALVGDKVHTTLETLVRSTLDVGKSMKSEDAPNAWRAGRYQDVIKYCIKNCQLTYDLYMHGKENGIVKSRKLSDGSIIDIEVEW